MASSQDTALSPGQRKRRRGRREKSLAGTHLFREVRTDVLIWRRTHPVTKKRLKKTTGTKILEYALVKAQEFEDELERDLAGIKSYDGWTQELAPLVAKWFEDQRQQDNPPQEGWLKQKEMLIARVLRELGLERAADLTDVGKIDRRLKALRKPDATLRRRYQDPLKQFSKWLAENGRYLERDPLAIWKTISYEAEERHRAFSPDEVARALVAAGWLDAIHNRTHSLKPAFTTLLVTAPRASAFTSRDVAHYLADERRIDFGGGCGKKGRGQGKLDDHTAAELEEYLGEREEGPLFLSPRGKRLPKRNLLRWWREAFGLGLVWELWPADEPWVIETGHLVNQSLLTGETRIRDGGNPHVVTKETRRERRVLRAHVEELVEEIRPEWEQRMVGVTLHAFRHTHETWARALDVDQVLINLQVGWKVSSRTESFDVLRVSSTTGLSRYLDARSKLLDARESAVAVRGLLDAALGRVDEELASALAPVARLA